MTRHQVKISRVILFKVLRYISASIIGIVSFILMSQQIIQNLNSPKVILLTNTTLTRNVSPNLSDSNINSLFGDCNIKSNELVILEDILSSKFVISIRILNEGKLQADNMTITISDSHGIIEFTDLLGNVTIEKYTNHYKLGNLHQFGEVSIKIWTNKRIISEEELVISYEGDVHYPLKRNFSKLN